MLLYLGLGSNLGQRADNIRHALSLLESRVGKMVCCSSLHQTEPQDMVSEHPFLNAAATFETALAPHDILQITQDIERALGRERKSENGEHFDRTIDIDLLQYGDYRLQTPQLTLPHPEMAKRDFVLKPLAEIAPHERHALPPYPTFLEMMEQQAQFQMVEITTAQPQDWEGVNDLIDQLSPGKSISWDDYQALLANDSTHLALLMESGDAPRVVCRITLCTTFCPTGRKAWIEDVAVHTDYRGRGLSHHLLAWAKTKAQDLLQKKVMLTSRPTRVAANKLYQGEGFAARETNVYQLVF